MAWTFADSEAYWRFLIDLTALGPLVRALPEMVLAGVREVLNERLDKFTQAGGIVLPSECWGAIAFR
jgi:hypothetical protein